MGKRWEKLIQSVLFFKTLAWFWMYKTWKGEGKIYGEKGKRSEKGGYQIVEYNRWIIYTKYSF